MMSVEHLPPSTHTLAEYVHRLEAGEALLSDSHDHVVEVIGILKSYGVVLDAYSVNLIYIAEHQFLRLFPFFKYFNGDFSIKKLFRHWFHNRINYEYAEYCMKAMLWHQGGGLADYVDSPKFRDHVEPLIQAQIKFNPMLQILHKIFPEFLPEQMRVMCYYSGLGQFWRVMSDIFLALSDRYDRGEIHSIAQVVQHIQDGLVTAASKPITYSVSINQHTYDVIPKEAGITFLADTAVPYVEAIFFRGTPFPGTVSYNAQAFQIPLYQKDFAYGALFADPLPIGGSGIPPTQLMQDMRHFLPDYLHDIYKTTTRGEDDIRVKICETFQKSMFCVTTAAIRGLAPHAIDTSDPVEQRENRRYFETWMNRFVESRIREAQA